MTRNPPENARTRSISCDQQTPLEVDGGRPRLERVVNKSIAQPFVYVMNLGGFCLTVVCVRR